MYSASSQPPKNGKITYIAVGIFFSVCLIALIGRFFYLQIIKHDDYEKLAISQQTSDTAIQAKRGAIVDRNGNELAVSATAYLITMSPSSFKSDDDRELLASGLSEILSLDYSSLLEKTKRNTSYAEIIRGINKEKEEEVAAFLNENKSLAPMVSITEIPKRFYPHGNLLSTVLGFVGTDNHGLEGVEYLYDDYLKGTNGKIITSNNARGTSMPFEYEQYISAKDGCTVKLTIDIEMQYFLEKHIQKTRVEHNVQNRVAACIMDVKTGEILAMSTKPDYDPNDPFTINDELILDSLASYLDEMGAVTDEYIKEYNKTAAELRTNKMVVEQYDPGSTFKIFTSAMALEEKLPILNETFYCSGSITKGVITYHCHKRSGHEYEDFQQALANSCNPVFIQIAEKIGIERFYNYITIFGLREKTGVGLPGEVAGIHHSLASMTDYNLYSSSFGQTFKITGMQLIAGVSAIANGGTYLQPYIIKEIIDADGNIVVANEPKAVRQVVSKETAETLWSMLEYVVNSSEQSRLPGYKMAGKTGTSQKVSDGTYENSKKIASFICFAPANDPQICVLVIVDEPEGDQIYGSYIAAPLGREIMLDCMKHLNIEPEYDDKPNKANELPTMPNLLGYDSSDAFSELIDRNLYAGIVGGEGIVTGQMPAEGTTLPDGATVILYTNDTPYEKKTVVPDVIGKTSAECNEALLGADLNIKVKGVNINYPDVVAVSQSPAAGTTVDKTTVVTVTFE
ncbi:MAG: PASTA domain-containing protein [Clostridia bacterium]|nr:PASTA domain-containing protein [Clostridia bacterium]